MKLKLTVDDVLKARPLPEGWYNATITEVKHELSAKKDSVNTTFTFSVTDKAGNEREIPLLINNKNSEMFNKRIVGLVEAIQGTITSDVELDDFNELCKKPLSVHLIQDSWGGIPRNQIDGFLKEGAGVGEIPLDI